MTYVNKPQDFNAKHKRVQDAYALKEPDQVPKVLLATSWGYSYSKVKIMDVIHDKEKLADAMTRYCEDIYSDMVMMGTINAPLLMYEILKPNNPQYLIFEDGYSLQHFECADMNPEEYPLLIEDPLNYIENIILTRRYSALREPYPKNYHALKDAYSEAMKFLESIVYAENRLKDVYGLPAMSNSVCYMPIDIVFDFLRGFKGVQMDIRRHGSQLIEACDKLADVVNDISLGRAKKGDVIFCPLHLASFLSPKQFEKFYWPSFKKVLDFAHKKGVKLLCYLENNWTPYFEFLQELPKGLMIAMIEYGDMSEVKKKLGDKIAIMGGMPTEKLRYQTKEECIDYTKKILDICAPGGGYLWSTDKIWLSPDDVNVENYKACVDTVRTHGKY